MRRVILIGALTFSAATHAYLAPAHLREMPVVGVLFVGAALAAAVLAIGLLVQPASMLVTRAGVVLLASLVLAYVPFVSIRLPFAKGTPEAIDRVAIICKLAELIGLCAALSVIRSGRRRARNSALLPIAAVLGAAIGFAVPAALGAGSDGASIVMQMNQFMPGEAVGLASGEIVWRNDDARSHTVTADDGSFDSGPIAPGGSFSLRLKPGTYSYHCSIHRFMRGVVAVYDIAFLGPRRAAYLSTASFTGRVAPGTSSVTIEAQSPSGQWEKLVDVTPDGDGAFAVSLPAAHEILRARAGSAISQTLELRISPHLTLTARSSAVEVAVVPAQPGARVALERYDRFHFAWVVVAKAHFTAAAVTFPYRPSHQREYLRAELLRPVAGYARATSHPLIVGRAGP